MGMHNFTVGKHYCILIFKQIKTVSGCSTANRCSLRCHDEEILHKLIFM